MLPSFGTKGQKKLENATVGVLGVGGLGCPASLYLAAAGVGKIILVDCQAPEISNLNRQVLHWERDVSDRTQKSISAASKLKKFNSSIEIESRTVLVTEESIADVFPDVNVVLDCLDDFDPRYVLNDFCVSQSVPFVHGAVEGFHGQITTIVPGMTPCLKCIFPRTPPRKDVFPILGATAGVFGTMQASEAIKLITGVGQPLTSKLLVGDLLYQEWDTIALSRVDGCPVCRHL